MVMVLPQKDISRTLSTYPVALVGIIALNVVVFIVELVLGDSFVERYALKPNEIVHGHQLETLFTSMFMHASLLHIGGNMLFLWIFGSVLEADYLGSLRFAPFSSSAAWPPRPCRSRWTRPRPCPSSEPAARSPA